jgi:hypothetical protein
LIIVRLLQAIVTSACMVGIFALSRRLFGQPVALIAISLLLLEPFFLAYQRFITTDALQTDFATLALLLFLLYLRGDADRRWLFVSGGFMGLATASKISALFVVPAICIWIVLTELGVWQASFPRRGWLRQGIDITLWVIMLGATIFAIWPALWVAPLETFNLLYEGLTHESVRGNFFFLGQHTDSPGLLFYPLVLAFRLSPILQFGVLACLAAILHPKLRPAFVNKPELVALGIVPLVVLTIFSVVESKIDRYIVLIIPELAVLAAVGWYTIVIRMRDWVIRYRQQRRQTENESQGQGFMLIAVAFLGLAQLFLLVSHYPYYITYYNPLLGGLRVAQHVFMVGQGEGLDRAAHWLNQAPNAKNTTVCSWYSGAFKPYFKGRTLDMCWVDKPKRDLLKAHRIALYINQRQRQLPVPEVITYFALQQPLHTVQVKGLAYVQLYPGLLPLDEDLNRIQVPLSLSMDSHLQLLGYDLSTSALKPGDEFIITFYWKFLETPPQNWQITISMIDDQDRSLVDDSAAGVLNGYIPFTQIKRDMIVRDVRKLTTGPGTQPGRYRLAAGWDYPDGESPRQVVGEIEVISLL